jgi:rhamnose utilization protein RhaD (predicted bifunctional aldolase and dehydrogenase)
MAKEQRPDMRRDGVPGWVRVVDDFGTLMRYTQVEDLKGELAREATPEEKDAIEIDLEWLERHVIADDNGCWVWQGFVSKQGQPQCRISVKPYVTATMLVRRLVARMKYEPSKKFPDAARFMRNRQAGVPQTCSRGCVHPDHVVMRTKKQAMAGYRGTPMPLTQRMRISAAKRKVSKVSDEVIRQVMVDPRPAKHVSVEIGMSECYVAHVREGKLRAYSSLGYGLFAGLLAPANGEFYDEEKTA